MSRTLARALLLCMLTTLFPYSDAATVRSWSASTEEDFARGTLDGVAIDEHG
jgi:hypothetical protein